MINKYGKKKCNKCGKYKSIEDFHKDKKNKDGLVSWCKDCVKEYDKEQYLKNRQKILNRKKEYWKEHRKNLIKKHKIWADNHKEDKKKYNVEYRKKNIKKLKAYRKVYYLKNKEILNKKNNLYQRKRRKTNINYRLKCYIRRRIALAMETNSKRSKTLKLLGCSIEFLKNYLESKFKPGMSWENHGQFGWHIDHIRPCCTFDLSKPSEQRECFHYTNLQPLWWQDNIRKGYKYAK
jgi:hypothetical protein